MPAPHLQDESADRNLEWRLQVAEAIVHLHDGQRAQRNASFALQEARRQCDTIQENAPSRALRKIQASMLVSAALNKGVL